MCGAGAAWRRQIKQSGERSSALLVYTHSESPANCMHDGAAETSGRGAVAGRAPDRAQAILPPLRRRVKKMISCCAIGHEPKGAGGRRSP